MGIQQPQRFSLNMTPMVRWMMSFSGVLEQFSDIFNESMLDRLAKRYHEAENRVRSTAQSLLKIDLLLLLVLTVPHFNDGVLFGFSIKDIVFINEALLIASSAAFFFLAWQFVTARAYQAMIESICNRKSLDPTWNGAYFSASHIDQELALHVSTGKLLNNPVVPDLWRGGAEMKEVEQITKHAMLLIVGLLLLLHFGVSVAAIWHAFFFSKIGSVFGFPIGLLACSVNVTAAVYFWKINYKNIPFEMDLTTDSERGN